MLSSCLGLLLGCASNEQTPEQRLAAKKARIHCKSEAPTGSIRRVSRCRSPAQIRAEREAAQEAMSNRTSVSAGSMEGQ